VKYHFGHAGQSIHDPGADDEDEVSERIVFTPSAQPNGSRETLSIDSVQK
jgi:hypothetical protein